MRMYKERCKMQRRGFCDTEYITKDGQERGACYGYRDRANDEILDQCRNCLDFVWNVGEEERLQENDMGVYRVKVILEEEYDDIEADSEEEAFELASNYAMSGGSWEYEVEEVE